MSRLKNITIQTAAAVFGLAVTAGQAFAQITEDSSINPSGSSDFTEKVSFKEQFISVANKVISLILLITGVLAVLYLIWSGIQYITSSGNPEKTKLARAGIINAVIGIVIIVAAYFIIKFAVSIGNTVSTT